MDEWQMIYDRAHHNLNAFRRREMFCENCGAKDGETDEEYMHRMGINSHTTTFEQTVFTVALTPWGYVCQYCEKSAHKGRYHDYRTGDIAVTGMKAQPKSRPDGLPLRLRDAR